MRNDKEIVGTLLGFDDFVSQSSLLYLSIFYTYFDSKQININLIFIEN